MHVERVLSFPLGFLVTPEETEGTDLDRCREILARGTTRGVLLGDRLVGYCGYRPHRLARVRHRGELGPFFVIRSYQGRGAARVLLAGVLQDARGDGAEQLELHVDAENHRAIAFYESLGFERIAVHPDDVRIDGVARDAHFYRLRLVP